MLMEPADKTRVLVVEDEPDVANIIRKLLEKRCNASAEVALNVREAREKLHEAYDIVTLDYQMPDGDGLALLKEIVDMPDAPGVVMVTGHGDENTAVESFRNGASGYVVKDQRMAELLTDAVNKALINSRLKAAEQSLLASEREYESVVETANSIILKLDADGMITYINRFGLEFFGYTKEEIIGKDSRDMLVPQLDSNGRDLRSMIDEILDDIEGFATNVNENIKKNGERVWVTWSNRALVDTTGRTVGNLAIGNDITELKKAQDERQLLSEIVWRLPVPVDVFKIEEPGNPRSIRHIITNPAARVAAGVPAEVTVGRLLLDTYPDYGETGIPERYLEAVREQKPFEIAELEYGDDLVERKTYHLFVIPLDKEHFATFYFDKAGT